MNSMQALMAVAFLWAVALSPESADAQGGPKWRGSGGWGPGGQYARIYDVKTVETVSGEVVKVDYATPMRGMSAGVHVVLKTAKGEMSVHLGPAWYVERQDVKLAPGDTIEVKGSLVTVGGKPALVAAQIKKGPDTLTLRDEAGAPAWAGWRRG